MPKMNKTVVVTMDDELYCWLNKESIECELSKSAIIRNALLERKKTNVDDFPSITFGDPDIKDSQREMLGDDADYLDAAGIDNIGCK